MAKQKYQTKKRFGQHFLVDQSIINQIVSSIAPVKGEPLVEIGPGQGVLTRPLLEQAAEMHVVELDRDLVSYLQQAFPAPLKLHIHSQDVLKFDFKTLGFDRFRLVGNLPYNISTPLIFHLLETPDLIKDMTFMLQKEVADRITASAGTKQYGRLSIMVQYFCDTEYLFDVPKEAFDPPPKVMSAIIRLIPKKQRQALTDQSLFNQLVMLAFNQRRKTLRNALKTLATEEDLEAVSISPQLRGERLEMEAFVRLSNYLSAK